MGKLELGEARADEMGLFAPHPSVSDHITYTSPVWKVDAKNRVLNMPLRFCMPCGERKIPDTLCQACRAIYYCSRECQQMDQARHRSECSPSVLVEGATSIESRVKLSSAVQQFEQEALLRRGAAKEPPAVLGTREITVDPRNFVTVSLVIDGRKHTSIYFSPDLDLRWRLPDATDDECYLSDILDLPPGDDRIVLIAPGKKMVADLERRRASAEGDEPRPITLPDERLIDFAQSISSSYKKEERRTLAHIVEWYEWGTRLGGDTKLV